MNSGVLVIYNAKKKKRVIKQTQKIKYTRKNIYIYNLVFNYLKIEDQEISLAKILVSLRFNLLKQRKLKIYNGEVKICSRSTTEGLL